MCILSIFPTIVLNSGCATPGMDQNVDRKMICMTTMMRKTNCITTMTRENKLRNNDEKNKLRNAIYKFDNEMWFIAVIKKDNNQFFDDSQLRTTSTVSTSCATNKPEYLNGSAASFGVRPPQASSSSACGFLFSTRPVDIIVRMIRTKVTTTTTRSS